MTKIILTWTIAIMMMTILVPLSPVHGEDSNEVEAADLEPIHCSLVEREGGLLGDLLCDPQDTDKEPDGKIDVLLLTLTLEKSVTSNFTLVFSLSSKDPMMNVRGIKTTVFLNESSKIIEAIMNGSDIYKSRLQFPLLLEITFIDEKNHVTSTTYALEGKLNYLDFESPYVAAFPGTFQYEPIDTNGNAKFEQLNVQFPVSIRSSGDFLIVGELSATTRLLQSVDHELIGSLESETELKGDRSSDSSHGDEGEAEGTRGTYSTITDSENDGTVNEIVNGKVLNYDPNVSYLPRGIIIGTDTVAIEQKESEEVQVNVSFIFRDIGSVGAKWAGPYRLKVEIYHENEFVDSIEWVIGRIAVELPEARGMITGRYQFTRVDNGSVLSVEVDIESPGEFILYGTAYPNIITHSMSVDSEKSSRDVTIQTYLDPGLQKLELTFPGEQFLLGGEVSLVLINESSGWKDARDIKISPSPDDGDDPEGPMELKNYDLADQGIQEPSGSETGGYGFLQVYGSVELPIGEYSFDALLLSSDPISERWISSMQGVLTVKEDGQSPLDDEIPESNKTIMAKREIKIQFPGEDIYINGLDGPYVILFYFSAANGSVYYLKETTNAYRSSQFSPFGGRQDSGPEPEFELTSDSVFLHTDVLASQVSKNSPEIVFYYYTDMGESVRFRVRFTRLLLITDNGDGVFGGDDDQLIGAAGSEQGDERVKAGRTQAEDVVAYQAFLSNRNWEMSPVTHGIDRMLGAYISFNLSTIITLEPFVEAEKVQENITGSIIRNWGRLTLHFLLANNTVNETELRIQGGEELKITVEVEPWIPTSYDAVVLEQVITYELDGKQVGGSGGDGSNDDSTTGGSGGNSDSGNERDEALSISFGDQGLGTDCTEGIIPSLKFVTGDGAVLGYYSWECQAIQYNTSGNGSRISVGSSAGIEKGRVTLYLSYPISSSVTSIVHDPSVGINREHAPTISISIPSEDMGDPWGYAFGLMIAVTVIVATIFPQRTKRKPSQALGHNGRPGGL